ncbi:hypothetical protein ACN47E_003842 [Coniothyrium glycines]
MSDMKAALDAARIRLVNGGNTAPTLNPTPDSSSRDNTPITTAHSAGLPIVDISPFLDPESSRERRTETASAINAACINYGFFYLTGHGIPLSTLDKIIDLARQFFALAPSEKHKIKRFDAGHPSGGDGARGYQGLGENVTGGLQDMQEAIDLYAPWPADKREKGDGGDASVKTLQGENLWPANPPELRSAYEAYIADVKKVGAAVVHAMGVALGLGPPAAANPAPDDQDEQLFVRACEDSFWVLRMIAYPPLPSSHLDPPTTITSPSSSSSSSSSSNNNNNNNEDTTTTAQFSCGAHTDYGCITLLLTDPTPQALHIRLKDGTWLPASPLRGLFTVNIGDMMERWTNGIWKSTLHRVVHRGDGNGHGEARISVPFFFEPGFDAVVRPLDKCVARSGGKRVVEGEGTYGEHLLTKVFNNFYFSKRTEW